ncbi:MAG: AAA-like domain-containing protein [Myxococcota bacterium]
MERVPILTAILPSDIQGCYAMLSNMQRFFNTAGPLNAAEHYCLDPLSRWDLPEVLTLINQKKYFLVHAPRQTGKTTCLHALSTYLNRQGDVHCVYVSVQQGQAARQDVDKGIEAVLTQIAVAAQRQLRDDFLMKHWRPLFEQVGAVSALLQLLTQWSEHSRKPIVLLLDEIDALVGNTLIAVLHQLRTGYCDRNMSAPFPQSIVLCGMRHLRDYRMELGKEGKQAFAESSPFNINSKSLRLGDFSLVDIQSLYAQHTQETGQQFENGVCERVFELTQGQPWLVNALAYETCFENKVGQDRSKTITVQAIDLAKEKLIQRRETHLDQLMAKLKQERVRRVIQPFLLGEARPIPHEDVEYVLDLGLLRQGKSGGLFLSNPIYGELIPRAMTWDFQDAIPLQRPAYVDTKGQLCMEWLMQEFQQFFRENSDSWLEGFQYKEAGPHLILQAFLQRIVNGGGTIAREYALGRKRTDLLVVWQQEQRVVLELKLVHSKDGLDKTLHEGLQQTAQYMDSCAATEGHLLLFDRRAGKSWDERIWVKHETSSDGTPITVWGL